MDNQNLFGLDISTIDEPHLFSTLFLGGDNNTFADFDFEIDESRCELTSMAATEPYHATVFPRTQENILDSRYSSDASSVTLLGDEFFEPSDYTSAENKQTSSIAIPRSRCPAILKEKKLEMRTDVFKSKEVESRPSKRTKVDESIITFSVESLNKVLPRKRKQFSTSRKREVALNRKIGACLHCKLKKTSCNFGLPCTFCVKRAGNNALLGQQLCSRKSLISTRFDHIDILKCGHWISQPENMEEQISSVISGPAQTAYIGYQCFNQDDWRRTCIKVTVIPFDSSSIPTYPDSFDVAFGDEFRFEMAEFHNATTTIEQGSIPHTDRLLKSFHDSFPGHKYTDSCITGPSAPLFRALGRLVNRYCSTSTELPLKPLVEKASRLQKLFNIISVVLEMRTSPDDEYSQFASLAIRGAIRKSIARELVQLEVSVLGDIDQLITKADGIGRRNPLATWLCLWTLVFTYKARMIATWYWNRFDTQCYELSRQLYRILTSIYSALYKTTSPLTLDWRKEEVSELLGYDSELIRLFCNVKTEMFWLQTEMNYLRPEDNLFKTLVVDNEVKLLAAHRKAAKKQGIL